jgi:hypothetical protein
MYRSTDNGRLRRCAPDVGTVRIDTVRAGLQCGIADARAMYHHTFNRRVQRGASDLGGV